MLRKFRAWLERREAAQDESAFDQGLRWAHDEIIFGRGFNFVRATLNARMGAFDRGVLEAIAAHVRLRESLGLPPVD